MKAFAPIEKDSLILMSILCEDLPALFNTIKSGEIAQNLVYMHGIAHKMDLEFEDTRKYFRSEFKSILDDKSWSGLVQFFDTFIDKLSMADEQNRNNIIYCTTFAYRFLYNLYFLNNAQGSVQQRVKVLSHREKAMHLLESSSNSEIDNEIDSADTPVSTAAPESMLESTAAEEKGYFFNSKTISILKSLVTNEDEEFVQKSFIEMSEVFYYMPNLKSLGLNFDSFREALTHGITGCFLLESFNEELALSLSKNMSIDEFIANCNS